MFATPGGDPPFTQSFDEFWAWLTAHPNCILRAGTPEAVLYDDDDLHWDFTVEEPRTLLVQVLRGKRLAGELLVDAEHVSYVVAGEPERADEHVFELIVETEDDRVAAYFFVLVHGQGEEGEEADRSRVH